MENYLPLILIVIVAGITLFAKKIADNIYGNILFLALALFVIVELLVTLDFSNPRIFYSLALLLFAGYVLVRSILQMRKLSIQKR